MESSQLVGVMAVSERMNDVTEDIRHRQDHIQFLENYITEITNKIDELTDGKDYEKIMESLEYRIEVLKKANGKFPARLSDLEKELPFPTGPSRLDRQVRLGVRSPSSASLALPAKAMISPWS